MDSFQNTKPLVFKKNLIQMLQMANTWSDVFLRVFIFIQQLYKRHTLVIYTYTEHATE